MFGTEKKTAGRCLARDRDETVLGVGQGQRDGARHGTGTAGRCLAWDRDSGTVFDVVDCDDVGNCWSEKCRNCNVSKDDRKQGHIFLN